VKKKITISIDGRLYSTLANSAKARGLSIPAFISQYLAHARYDLVTEDLVRNGHLSIGRCDKNETVL
jgi:hypothetical protein